MSDLFFVLSKTLWIGIKPETWFGVLLLAALLAILKNRRRLGLACISAGLVAFALVATMPVGDALLAPLERQFPARPPVREPAYIVVLGGGEDLEQSMATGMANLNEAGDRLIAAIELANDHPDAMLILSGNSSKRRGSTLSVAEIAAQVLSAAGISRNRLLLETVSRNTAENAKLSASMSGVDTSHTTVLVTSAFHMPRSLGVFCKAGWADIIPYPVDYRAGNSWARTGWKFAINLEELNLGVREWAGLIAYRLTGRTTSLIPRFC